MWLSWLSFFLFFAPTRTNEINAKEESPAKLFYHGAKYMSEENKHNSTGKNETSIANSNLESTPETHFIGQFFMGKNSSVFKNRDLVTMMAEMAWQTADLHGTRCHNVLVTMDRSCPLTRRLVKSDFVPQEGLTLFDFAEFSRDENIGFLLNVWSDSSIHCRSLLIDLTCFTDLELLRVLEAANLWQWNDIQVIFVGSLKDVHWTLHQRALRNVPRPLYLALEERLLRRLNNPVAYDPTVQDGAEEKVVVYVRCLYCGEGYPKIRFLAYWKLGSAVPEDFNPYSNQENNLEGHTLRITTFPIFPYTVINKKAKHKGNVVTIDDCIDKWMLDALSAKLNFSYEVRRVRTIGFLAPNGNWSGMAGMIQHEQADLTTMISLISERIHFMDFARSYVGESLYIVSLKPQELPRYLIIVRSFTTEVWLYLLLIVMLWGATLWVFQWIWSRFSQGKGITLSEGIFYSWAVFLEDPPTKLPINITGQMMFGWWLVTCLIISTMFKAELMANLAVARKEKPIDDYADMVAHDGWRWAMMDFYFKGQPIMYLKKSPDPVIKEVYKRIENVADLKEGLEEVSKGGFSFLCTEYGVRPEIASYYTDHKGWTPYYISKHGEKIFSDFGLGLRKGLPSGNRIRYYINRLIEVGLIEFWTQNMISSSIAKNRRAAHKTMKVKEEEEEEDSRVLRISHVMGVFLSLVLGFKISFIVLFLEIITYKYDGT